MEQAVTHSPSIVDDRLARVHTAGDRLMALSGLRYEGRFLSVGEYENVHVMEFGDGPPVILVHGAGSGGPVWHRQIATLAKSRRVIVPDVPMFGMSGMPSRIYAPREQISDVILGLMDALDIDKTDIVGHSMGAIGSAGALARAPERFNRAVLVSSPGFGRGLNFVLRLATMPGMRRFIDFGNRKSRYFFFDTFEAQKSGPSEEREILKALHFEVGNRDRGVDTFFEGIRRFANIFGQRDVLDCATAGKIKSPTLLIWGDSDRIIPTRHSKRAFESIPDARLEMIENCGHIVQLEAPDRLTKLIADWLEVS